MRDHLDEETMHRLTVDTLEELDWCLDQLEAIQAHRSVGDLATSKFRRMLNKELSHFSESKSGSQISGYIRSFLGEFLLFLSYFLHFAFARPAMMLDRIDRANRSIMTNLARAPSPSVIEPSNKWLAEPPDAGR